MSALGDLGGALRRELAVRSLWLRIFTFFAGPTDGSGAAVFRISFGVLTATVAAWTAMNADRWFSNGGVMVARGRALKSSLYRFGPELGWMPTLHVALLAIGAVMLVIGLFPRIGAFVVFVAHTSLQHRTPQILNSGDRLFAIVAFLAMTMPLGHRLSVHAWLRRRRGVPVPAASMWGHRLIQIQIAYVYAASALSKVQNGRWTHGKALRDVLASPVFAEWPTWLGFWPLVYAMTWGTLVFEFGFPTFVWFRKLRPWLLLAGVGFHLGIDLLMIIPMFSYIMIVCYAAFLDDDVVHRWLGWAGLGRAELGQAGLGAAPVADAADVPPTLRSASEAPPAVVEAPDHEAVETPRADEPPPPAPV